MINVAGNIFVYCILNHFRLEFQNKMLGVKNITHLPKVSKKIFNKCLKFEKKDCYNNIYLNSFSFKQLFLLFLRFPLNVC